MKFLKGLFKKTQIALDAHLLTKSGRKAVKA